MGGGLISIATI